jgi:hypothetical protein
MDPSNRNNDNARQANNGTTPPSRSLSCGPLLRQICVGGKDGDENKQAWALREGKEKKTGRCRAGRQD